MKLKKKIIELENTVNITYNFYLMLLNKIIYIYL